MSTRKKRRQLIEIVFGDDENALQDIEADATDRDELRQLEDLKGILTEHGHREPPESRREHLWSRLEGRLDEAPERRRFLAALPARAFLVGAAAMAAIAIAAVLFQRVSPVSPSPAAIPAQTVHAEGESGERLDNLIQRSTPLLMAVSNRNHEDELQAIDVSSEQRLATRLAEESRSLREASEEFLTRRDRRLVAELEAVLMQVANTDPSADGGEIALLRETIEDRQLLFEFALREIRRAAEPSRPERSRDA